MENIAERRGRIKRSCHPFTGSDGGNCGVGSSLFSSGVKSRLQKTYAGWWMLLPRVHLGVTAAGKRNATDDINAALTHPWDPKTE